MNHGFDFQKTNYFHFKQTSMHYMYLVNISLYFLCSLEITNLITWLFCFTDTLPHLPQNTSHKNHRKTKLIRLGESHTFDTYPCRSLCRKVPMSTLVYIMQWVHSLCVLSVADKKKNWLKIVITWVTQNLINFTRRTEWFTDILWPPFLLQHRRVAPNHMTWGHTDGGERWRPLLAGLPSLTWWDNWRLGFLDWWSITGSAGRMGQRSICGGHLWNWTVSRSAIQSGKKIKENIKINFINTSMI